MRNIKITNHISWNDIKTLKIIDSLHEKLYCSGKKYNSSEKASMEQDIKSLEKSLLINKDKMSTFALRTELFNIKLARNAPLEPLVKNNSKPLGHRNRFDTEIFENSISSKNVGLNEDVNRPQKENKRVISLHCPKCGYKFIHEVVNNGQISGGIGGVATGAILGGKIGIALGPLGAIAGTVPGAILGGILGKNLGNDYDSPICPNCSTKFQIPNSIK